MHIKLSAHGINTKGSYQHSGQQDQTHSSHKCINFMSTSMPVRVLDVTLDEALVA